MDEGQVENHFLQYLQIHVMISAGFTIYSGARRLMADFNYHTSVSMLSGQGLLLIIHQ
jgi:hypothetical protein